MIDRDGQVHLGTVLANFGDAVLVDGTVYSVKTGRPSGGLGGRVLRGRATEEDRDAVRRQNEAKRENRRLSAAENNLIAPAWSGGGRLLVFGSKSGSGSCDGDFLYQLDLQTRALSRVEGSEGQHYATSSPDGLYLAASCNSRIRLLNLATRQWSLLTNRASRDFTWSHDSHYLYLYLENGEDGIFRIRVRDGSEQKVAETHGFQAAAGDFGFWLGLAPDDTPLLLRNLSSDRIYALEWDAP